MLLAVSGIVHATPSRRTFDAVISEPVATRWLRTSPLAESHGGAGSVPAVATASPIVGRTSARAAPARAPARRRWGRARAGGTAGRAPPPAGGRGAPPPPPPPPPPGSAQ